MDRYTLITLVALLVLVVAMPVYMQVESERMERAQATLQATYLAAGAETYLENCVSCHGPAGEGVGAMPALNTLGQASYDSLYHTIGHSPHGSPMSIWHVGEGGLLKSHEVEGLVTLIMAAEWPEVEALAVGRGEIAATPRPPQVELALVEGGVSEEEDPHECRSCHEQPEAHAERFGLNCSRCHTLEAWKPARLTRHTFLLDHGGGGRIDCQTCHTETYSDHTCYGCHDHTPAEMERVHLQEGIFEIEDCASCHPTGQEGEGEQYRYDRVGEMDQISGEDLPSEPFLDTPLRAREAEEEEASEHGSFLPGYPMDVENRNRQTDVRNP